MNATAPVTLACAGEVYFRYAGPFKNDNQARLMVEDLFASGEVDASDNRIIHCRAVYLRERA